MRKLSGSWRRDSVTAMSSSGNYERRTLRSTLETISSRIRSVSLWVWVTLQQPLSLRKLLTPLKSPQLPPEDLAPEIRAARMQRITAERKLALTEKRLGAEVAAVKERLQQELDSDDFSSQVLRSFQRRER